MSSRRPNFFIVGAPKAGTTSLYEYLRMHPNICMASYKEPHYFADDLKNYGRAESLQEYLSFFRHCDDSAIAVGEGSVWYLRSKTALKNIREFAPESRIIVMLRNPVELVRSFHAQALYSFIEDEEDLERAWNLQDRRASGKCIPSGNQVIETLMYRDMARLGEQVARAMTIFPREQIKLIFFEDFIADTRREYMAILDFLCVPCDGRASFPPINEAKGHRFEWLGKATSHAPRPVVNAVHLVRRTTGLDPMKMIRRVRHWNTSARPKQAINVEFRRVLAAYFEDDIRLLEQLTGRDLSHWS